MINYNGLRRATAVKIPGADRALQPFGQHFALSQILNSQNLRQSLRERKTFLKSVR